MVALYVFLGGGLGSLLRYGLGLWLPSERFPVGIFVCNLVGCFLIGVLAGCFPRPNEIQVGLITGLLGGFTTFSSFSQASLKLLSSGQYGMGFLHIGVSVLGGLLCTYLGLQLAKGFL